jgi:uncharacterized membrane protein YwaF
LEKSEYLFGTRHIIMLVMTVLLCVFVGLIFRKRSDKAKNGFFHFCATILLFFEIATRVVNLWFASSYTIESVAKIILPMHICSVMVWLIIIGIYSDSKLLLNYSSIAGLLATFAFLVYPAVGINQKYMAFTNIYSTVSHMIGFVLAISLMTLRKVEFRFKKIWQPYLCLIIMFTWGYLLNWVIFPGSDYMYMRNDPLELKLTFPYQYLYGGILIVYIFMFYFINLFTRKKEKKEAVDMDLDIESALDKLSHEDLGIEKIIHEGEITPIVSSKSNQDGLSSMEHRVLEVIEKNPRAPKKQIAIDAKLTDAELDKQLKHLKEIGKIERVGPGNGGYWKIN